MCNGAMTAASPGASWSTPQNGLITDCAMTSWSYERTHASLLATFGLAIRRRRTSPIPAASVFGEENGSFSGGVHSDSSWSCGQPSCKKEIGMWATGVSSKRTTKAPESEKLPITVASTSCSSARASNASQSFGLTPTVIRS